MKRILFIIHSLNNKGGSERVAIELANLLSEFYNIEILCKVGSEISYSLDNRVKVTYAKGNGLKLLFAFKRYIKINNYDFILVHSMTKLTLGLLLCGVRHKNFNSLEHTSFFNTKNIIQLFFKKILYKYIRSIIVLTNNDKLEYDKFHSNVIVIKNPSPFPIEKHNDTNSKILAVGSLVCGKGFDRLVQAWSLIEKDSDDYILEIYGEGIERIKLEQMIKKLKLKKIFLKGQIDNIENIYKNASFFVMSSHFEGLPMVLIEAQTFGLPIVSFDCPFGPSEIIENNYDGYLVENGNIQELANKILYLIKNKKTLNMFSQNAIKSATKFQKEKIVLEWKKIIEK